MPSNSDLLTRSHAAIAAKRNDKRNQVKEVLFDDNARRLGSSFLVPFFREAECHNSAGSI